MERMHHAAHTHHTSVATTTVSHQGHEMHMHHHHTTVPPINHHDMHGAVTAESSGSHDHHLHHTIDQSVDHHHHMMEHESHGDHSMHHDHDTHKLFFHTGWDVEALFENFSLDTKTGIFCIILAAILLGIVFESVKFLRSYIHRDITLAKSKMTSREHILQTILYLIQIISSYILMLVIMTYNIWVILATVLGICVGYFLCQWRMPLASRTSCSKVCQASQENGEKDCCQPELQPLKDDIDGQDQIETKL